MNGLQVAILGAALFCYFLYRQCAQRPVTRNDFLVPGIAALYAVTRYLGGAGLQLHDAVFILTGSLVGVGTGLLSGQMIRVWRDQESGLVYQFGGWRYAGAFFVLLLLRVAMRVIADRSGFTTTAAVLNDAFIGMIVGNFLGRAVNVGVRAMPCSTGSLMRCRTPSVSDACGDTRKHRVAQVCNHRLKTCATSTKGAQS